MAIALEKLYEFVLFIFLILVRLRILGPSHDGKEKIRLPLWEASVTPDNT